MDINKFLEEVNFTNDYLFKEVMLKRKDLCKEIIQRCLPDLDIGEIEVVKSEKEVTAGFQTKKIRIDAYTSDKETEYAIEMMTYRVKSIEKYSRYHQSMLDANLEIGRSPWELKDTIVIILCTYDPLGLGKAKYTIRSRIDEANKSIYNDGRRIVIVTSVGLQEASEEIKPIVQLLANQPGHDDFTEEIQKTVNHLKIEPSVRRYLMDRELREQLMREEAIRQGHEEGVAQGRKEGLEQGIEKGIEKGIEQSIQALMKNMNITREEAERLLSDDKKTS